MWLTPVVVKFCYVHHLCTIKSCDMHKYCSVCSRNVHVSFMEARWPFGGYSVPVREEVHVVILDSRVEFHCQSRGAPAPTALPSIISHVTSRKCWSTLTINQDTILLGTVPAQNKNSSGSKEIALEQQEQCLELISSSVHCTDIALPLWSTAFFIWGPPISNLQILVTKT